jgi:hypothetical protein
VVADTARSARAGVADGALQSIHNGATTMDPAATGARSRRPDAGCPFGAHEEGRDVALANRLLVGGGEACRRFFRSSSTISSPADV